MEVYLDKFGRINILKGIHEMLNTKTGVKDVQNQP